MPSQSIEQLLQRVELRVVEAVAVVQQLIASNLAAPQPAPPYGPPSLDNVFLSDEGDVVCRACVVTPAVS